MISSENGNFGHEISIFFFTLWKMVQLRKEKKRYIFYAITEYLILLTIYYREHITLNNSFSW